jgi:hypothetical protein
MEFQGQPGQKVSETTISINKLVYICNPNMWEAWGLGKRIVI